MTNPSSQSPAPLTANASKVSHDQQQNRPLPRTWAWLLLLILGIAWGGSFSLAKIAVEEGAHPLGVNYWQSLIGAAILISYLVLTRQSLPMGRNYLSFYLICGFLGSVIPGLLYFYAVIHISPGVLAITIATVPIMTYIAAILIKIERRSVFRILGVCFWRPVHYFFDCTDRKFARSLFSALGLCSNRCRSLLYGGKPCHSDSPARGSKYICRSWWYVDHCNVNYDPVRINHRHICSP